MLNEVGSEGVKRTLTIDQLLRDLTEDEQSLIRYKKKFIIICGEKGTGKTHFLKQRLYSTVLKNLGNLGNQETEERFSIFANYLNLQKYESDL